MFYQCHLEPGYSEMIKVLRTSSRTKHLSISSSGVDALGKLGKIRVFQTSSRAKGLPITCSKALPLSYKRNQGTGPITERSDSEKKTVFRLITDMSDVWQISELIRSGRTWPVCSLNIDWTKNLKIVCRIERRRSYSKRLK